ncbi:MAG: RNA polymerase sigma factor [Pseudomonadales bacterium]|nr:RNA polymerase sigma factor [Pseudomonadales bacterium]
MSCNSVIPMVGAGDNYQSQGYDKNQIHEAIGSSRLDRNLALDRFLNGIEKRAFRMAQIATGSREDAFDIVQDAMFKLVEKYGGRQAEEWGALFHCILQSRITDWHRRNNVRNRFRSWLGSGRDPEEAEEDPLQLFEDKAGRSPERLLQTGRTMAALETALGGLPRRQQQVFLLRVWEGLDVKETARAMSCTEGSVKTHYSRAVHALREKLGEHWE